MPSCRVPQRSRRWPTKAYILVSYNRKLVEVYRWLEDNTWRYETLEGEGALEFPCLDLKMDLAEIYADIPQPD